ncbi:MAG: hypothetical protein JWP81_2572 [Ferruginibacter sp.]|nr:hypothetical protein [Ferruginibacter sp.]
MHIRNILNLHVTQTRDDIVDWLKIPFAKNSLTVKNIRFSVEPPFDGEIIVIHKLFVTKRSQIFLCIDISKIIFLSGPPKYLLLFTQENIDGIGFTESLEFELLEAL